MSSEKKEKKQHKMNFNIKEKLKKTFSKEHLKEVFTGEEQKKHLKQGSYSSMMTVIVLAVIVVINLIVAQIPTSKTQIDLSTQKMYSITDETKTALKDLDQDVTMYYIVQKGSEDDTIEKLLDFAFNTPADPLRSVDCVKQRCELIDKNLEYLKSIGE